MTNFNYVQWLFNKLIMIWNNLVYVSGLGACLPGTAGSGHEEKMTAISFVILTMYKHSKGRSAYLAHLLKTGIPLQMCKLRHYNILYKTLPYALGLWFKYVTNFKRYLTLLMECIGKSSMVSKLVMVVETGQPYPRRKPKCLNQLVLK